MPPGRYITIWFAPCAVYSFSAKHAVEKSLDVKQTDDNLNDCVIQYTAKYIATSNHL